MNKKKLPLTILCFVYCGVSFFNLVFVALSSVVMGNSSTINIMSLINWLIGIAPFVLILLYGLGTKNKILMLVSLVLPLIGYTKNMLQLLVQSIKFLFADASYSFAQSYGMNVLTNILGIAAFVILLLYVLNVFKNKTVAMVGAIVYFGISFAITLFSGLSSVVNRFLYSVFDKYSIFFTSYNLLNIITVSLSCAIWLIYIKTALINEE